MPIHAPTPHHAHAHRMAQSISDPTPISGSLGRSSTRGRLFEDFSRTPSPNTARARAKESAKKDKSRKEKLRRKRRDGGGGGADNDDHDDGASFSSGSTYYVLPSRGQKIKVVGTGILLYCLAALVRSGVVQTSLIVISLPHIASTEYEGALCRANIRIQVNASTPKSPFAKRALSPTTCTTTTLTTAKTTTPAANIPPAIRIR